MQKVGSYLPMIDLEHLGDDNRPMQSWSPDLSRQGQVAGESSLPQTDREDREPTMSHLSPDAGPIYEFWRPVYTDLLRDLGGAFWRRILPLLLTGRDSRPIASLWHRNGHLPTDLREGDIGNLIALGNLRHGLRPNLVVQIVAVQSVSICHHERVREGSPSKWESTVKGRGTPSLKLSM